MQWTVMQVAARSGYLDWSERLLDANVDVNAGFGYKGRRQCMQQLEVPARN